MSSATPVRTLVLMRHGHAAGMSASGDRGRPLTDHGRREVALVASVLAERGFRPEVVLVSSADRTRQTWQQASDAGLATGRVEFCDELYNASPEAIIGCLRELPPDAGQVLVVAHFPGIPDAVEQLSDGRGDGDAWTQLRWGFPTAAAATLAVEAPWSELAEADLVAFDTPS